MNDAPRLFDQALIRRRLSRAKAQGAEPFLLERAARDLAERLTVLKRHFETVADLGTPGILGTEALLASGKANRVIRIVPIAEDERQGDWLTAIGDSALVPLAQGSMDAVISLLALQQVDDLPGALIQIRRALKPDGLVIGCLLGGDTLSELRQAFAAAESEIEGGISPRVAPFADLRDLGGLLQRAGLALPVTDSDRFTVRYRHPLALMRDLRAMGATNALLARRREPLRRATLARVCDLYIERFSDPDGRVRATFEIVWFSGWVPHESQQKPLKPGSATVSLADVLSDRSSGNLSKA